MSHCLFGRVHIYGHAGGSSDFALACPKCFTPDFPPEPMNQHFQIIDMPLAECTEKSTKGCFIGNVQPAGCPREYSVRPDRYNRTNRTCPANDRYQRQKNGIHGIIKSRRTALMVNGFFDELFNPLFLKKFHDRYEACLCRKSFCALVDSDFLWRYPGRSFILFSVHGNGESLQ